MAKELIFKISDGLHNEETGEVCFKPELVGELIRCKDCKHYHAETRMCEGWIKQHVFLITNENGWCYVGERNEE